MGVSFIKQMLSESDGSPSSMRGFVLLIVLGVVAKNVYLSIKTGANVNFTFEEVGLITASLGIKAFQKSKEQPQPATTVIP